MLGEDESLEHLEAGTRELLAWVARSPRTYAETIDAWRSHCPRLAVWDDAVSDGLVRVVRGRVALTPRGAELLQRAPATRG